jgi:hypothetical protein
MEQVRAVYEVLLPHLAGGNLAEAITVGPSCVLACILCVLLLSGGRRGVAR